jgi:hypothetical protein
MKTLWLMNSIGLQRNEKQPLWSKMGFLWGKGQPQIGLQFVQALSVRREIAGGFWISKAKKISAKALKELGFELFDMNQGGTTLGSGVDNNN